MNAAQHPGCRICPYGVTSRCDGIEARHAARYESENTIGCLDGERQVRLYRDLHRDDFDLDRPGLQGIPPLPAFIPVLVRRLPRLEALPETGLYGVSWTTAVYPGGSVRYRSPEHIRRELGLHPTAKLCLFGTARDKQIEKAWIKSDENALWERLVALELEFTTGTTFSVWDRQPRFDQIYNQERNLWSFTRFSELGVPTVPFLFQNTAADGRATVSWLERHPEVDLVGVLAQFYRLPQHFDRLLEGMEALQAQIQRPLRFLVTGCSTGVKIERLFNRFPTATVVSTKPVMKALWGNETFDDLTDRPAPLWVDRHELVVRNIAKFARFCAAARPASALPA